MSPTGEGGWDERTVRLACASRTRDQEVIAAMQARLSSNVIRDLLWRKPWRARTGPTRGANWAVSVRNFWNWLWLAHDCDDPAVGCSCSGGYRFPNWWS